MEAGDIALALHSAHCNELPKQYPATDAGPATLRLTRP